MHFNSLAALVRFYLSSGAFFWLPFPKIESYISILWIRLPNHAFEIQFLLCILLLFFHCPRSKVEIFPKNRTMWHYVGMSYFNFLVLPMYINLSTDISSTPNIINVKTEPKANLAILSNFVYTIGRYDE
jgi:hypothetical protein